MAREGRSHVRKRKKGCLVGCLTNLMLLLGVIALVFVGAHVLGFVESDPQTGAPTLKLDHLPEIRLGDFDLSQIQPPDLSGMTEKLPKWAYGVNANGLTVKTLRAGDGEAVFVCADGYTMLLGAGSGTGASLCGQLLLCGANHLSAAVAMSSEDEQLGAMKLALGMTKPDYLFVPPTQTKGKAYAQMIDAAEKQGTQIVSAAQNMTFTLGRARVTFIGPDPAYGQPRRRPDLAHRLRADERRGDGLYYLKRRKGDRLFRRGGSVRCADRLPRRNGGRDVRRMGGGCKAESRADHRQKPRQQRAHSIAEIRRDGLCGEGKRRDDAVFGRAGNHGGTIKRI